MGLTTEERVNVGSVLTSHFERTGAGHTWEPMRRFDVACKWCGRREDHAIHEVDLVAIALDRLRNMKERTDDKCRLKPYVRKARWRGASWRQVGEALGVTGEGARYSFVTERNQLPRSSAE